MEEIFNRLKLLIGEEKLQSLHQKTVAIFGLGGVGSYVVEGLVRAGIGNICIVDKDIVDITFKVYDTMNEKTVTDTKVTVTFGGYANPSFEAQIETVGKAKTSGIMSIEASIDELYGDTKDEKWKLEEVKRIKNENGIVEMEEPAIAQDIDLIENNVEMEEEETNNIEQSGE